MSPLHDTEFDTTVVSRISAADGVDYFELGALDGATLPPWEPGAHIDVLLPVGGERQYSLSGSPSAPTWRIAVLREPNGRGGSEWMHDSVTAGDTVRVRGPRNHFTFSPTTESSYLFIAGGIGITPLAPMAEAAAAAGAPYRILYSGRSRSTMAMLSELRDAHPGKLEIFASDEGRRLDLDELLPTLDPSTVVYCCGPTRLIDAVESAASANTVHVERFEAKELGEPVLHESFEVELALTGTTLTVPPDRSILDVVEESGVLVLSSCQEGTCGTCETPVLEGKVDHRDSILTPDEQADNTVMYICVSRSACPRLVLEL